MRKLPRSACTVLQSIVAFCRRRLNCFAWAIDCGFVDADGRAALRVQLIMGLLPRIAEVWLRNRKRLCAEPRFVCAIPGLLRKSSDPSFV